MGRAIIVALVASAVSSMAGAAPAEPSSPREAVALALLAGSPEMEALRAEPALGFIGATTIPGKEGLVAVTAVFWDHARAEARELTLDLRTGAVRESVTGARPASTRAERQRAEESFRLAPEVAWALGEGGQVRGGFLYTSAGSPCGTGDRCLVFKVVKGSALLAWGLVDTADGTVVRAWSAQGGWR